MYCGYLFKESFKLVLLYVLYPFLVICLLYEFHIHLLSFSLHCGLLSLYCQFLKYKPYTGFSVVCKVFVNLLVNLLCLVAFYILQQYIYTYFFICVAFHFSSSGLEANYHTTKIYHLNWIPLYKV